MAEKGRRVLVNGIVTRGSRDDLFAHGVQALKQLRHETHVVLAKCSSATAYNNTRESWPMPSLVRGGSQEGRLQFRPAR